MLIFVRVFGCNSPFRMGVLFSLSGVRQRKPKGKRNRLPRSYILIFRPFYSPFVMGHGVGLSFRSGLPLQVFRCKKLTDMVLAFLTHKILVFRIIRLFRFRSRLLFFEGSKQSRQKKIRLTSREFCFHRSLKKNQKGLLWKRRFPFRACLIDSF